MLRDRLDSGRQQEPSLLTRDECLPCGFMSVEGHTGMNALQRKHTQGLDVFQRPRWSVIFTQSVEQTSIFVVVDEEGSRTAKVHTALGIDLVNFAKIVRNGRIHITQLQLVMVTHVPRNAAMKFLKGIGCRPSVSCMPIICQTCEDKWLVTAVKQHGIDSATIQSLKIALCMVQCICSADIDAQEVSAKRQQDTPRQARHGDDTLWERG
mmetsp:Transcript_44411/g.113071  ORF Transcript_44411/g.113071 Transcript_44411/m.113071 type:complete len:209 (-) Transcript_44411:16-642(-)